MEEERRWCVYEHTNKTNGKVYIGQTGLKPEERWQNGRGYKCSTYFYYAIQKYGWDGFEHEILYDNLTLEEANELEKELIAKYKSLNHEFGYNLQSGGKNFKETEETKRKISNATKGVNNPFYGKKHTDEAKEKMRKARVGTKASPEARKKLSEQRKGKKNNMYGKHWKASDETRKKISEANSGEGHYHKPILCIETGIVYWGGKDAEDKTGIKRAGICQCCRGIYKTAGGYHWKYVEEESK